MQMNRLIEKLIGFCLSSKSLPKAGVSVLGTLVHIWDFEDIAVIYYEKEGAKSVITFLP